MKMASATVISDITEYCQCPIVLCVCTVLAHMVKCKKCRLGLGVWIGIESY